MGKEEHSDDEPLIPPIHVNDAADAERVATHYENLYHSNTDHAYDKLGSSAEVSHTVTPTENGGADVDFDVTIKPKE